MFQIKSVDSITASIINNIRLLSDDITDFNIGSKARTIIEAISWEIEQFYQELLKGFYEAVPTALYQSFSFARLSAKKASGTVTFTKTAAALNTTVVVPANTVVRIPSTSYSYQLQNDLTIGSGVSSANGYVVATAAGADYNATVGAITELDVSIDGIAGITNSAAFATGADQETDNERKTRWRNYVRTLSRATEDALIYGAKTAKLTDGNGEVTESVVDAIVHELHEDVAGDPGFVDVYIWNGVDGASASLISQATTVLNGYADGEGNRVPGYKGAGVVLVVKAVIASPVNVAVTVTLDDGETISEDFENEIESKIGEYFSSLKIGDKVYIAKLIDMIMDLTNVIDVDFTAPSSNVTPDWDEICTLGTITISDGNAA